ncbi:hypothetical protein H6G65_18895 [Microcystis elabens FACHB-917]|nr:hypothetical protein [Microcystis elabens FACHB-917]
MDFIPEVAKNLKLLLKDKKYNDALAIVETALKGSFSDELFDSAILLYRQLGDHQKSLRLARDWISENPDDWRGYFHNVQALIDMQSFSEAASAVEFGLAKHPKNKQLLHAACRTFRRLGERQLSLDAAMRMIEIDPKFHLGYALACEDLTTLKMTDKAEEIIKNAKASGISSHAIKSASASLFLSKKDYLEVIKITRDMVVSFPDKDDAYVIMAEAFIALQDYTNAISCLASLDNTRTDSSLVRLVKNPALDDVQTSLLLRQILRRMEQDSKARSFFGKNLTGIAFERQNPERCDHVYAQFSKLTNLMCRETKLFLGLEENPSDLIERLVHNDEQQLIGILGPSYHSSNQKALKEYLDSSDSSKDTLLLKFYRKIFFPVAAVKAASFARLKIAVCLSGQLRGYRKAIKTWPRLFSGDHDFQFFCSTWDQTGNKKLIPQHASRLLPERFIPVFRDAWFASSDPQRDFEPLLMLFEIDNGVSAPDLKSLYSTDHVEVVPTNDYSGRGNQYCMHMMIERAFRLIPNPEEFDLIVRFRFDKPIVASDVNWHSLVETCNTSNALFADGHYISHIFPGVADQVAISNPRIMELYSTTFSKAQDKLYPFENFDGNYRGHKTLGLNLLANDVNVLSVPGVRFGRPETVGPDDEKAIFHAFSECKFHPAVLEKHSSFFHELAVVRS